MDGAARRRSLAKLKAGSRMRSAVCDTEVMVIATPDAEVDLSCGGAPMLDIGGDAPGGDIDPEAAEGTQIGKRYVNEACDLELL